MNQQPMMPQAPTVQGQPRPLRPVELVVNQVEASIVDLEHAVERFIDRVGPVLSQLAPSAPPAPQANGSIPSVSAEPGRSDLVLSLGAKNDALRDLIRRVEAVSARVEL